MARGQSSVTLGITGGGVKITGLPLSARGRSVAGLQRSGATPDCPAAAGIAADIANAKAARPNRMLARSKRCAAILPLEARRAMAI
jgi:hypothetical protein